MDRTTKSFRNRGIGSSGSLGRAIPNCSLGRPKGWSSDSIANRRGDRKETGDGQNHRDAGQAAERSDEERDSVGQRSDAVLAGDRVRLLLGDSPSEEAATGGAVPPETVPYDRQDEKRTRVQRGRHIRIGLLDVIGDQGGVEHREDHEQQEQAVEEHQPAVDFPRSEEHTSELQSPCNLVCRLLLEKKKKS